MTRRRRSFVNTEYGPCPPIDAEVARALRQIEQLVPRVAPDTLAQVRSIVADGIPGAPTPDFTAGGAVVVEESVVTGPAGAPDVPVVVLRPAEGSGPWPAIYNIHGGGMVAGTPRTALDQLVAYVHEIGVVVVSVDYRLAPEHPDPAPLEDCYAGLCWLADHSADLQVDPARIMIAGISAGGGLAAGTALLARDRGGPALTHQILSAPMLDDRLRTPSAQMLLREGVWDRAENEYGWASLLGDRRGGPDVSPYSAPARAEDLAGLPRTFIDVGSVETFRDEVIDYATRLSQAGVSVDLHVWGGGVHGFDLSVPGAAISRAALSARDAFIRTALGSRPHNAAVTK
ncbi:esterase [Nocardia nova]|nr:esterase [Nocardia nova]